MVSGNFFDSVQTSFLFVFWVSLILMIGITFAMIYFVIRYHHTRNTEAKDIHGHVGLELAWTVIPTILVLGMFYYGMVGYQDMEAIPDDAMKVIATGRMWNWEFEYENGLKTDTLYVPAGRPVALQLVSQDVIHSFYIPAFRIKKDVVPGLTNRMWFAADEPGYYDVFCAEYCGDQHSYMYTRVVALTEVDFNGWYYAGGTGTADTRAAVKDGE